MLKEELIIVNELGLHARPAAKMVKLAAMHNSHVSVCYGKTKINAKSIMGLMMLAVEKGGKITLEIEGEDETDLMAKMRNLIESGFGEDETENG